MAWRNAEIPLATCTNNNDTYWTAFPSSAAVSWNTYAPYMTNTNPIPHSELVPKWVYGDTTLGIRIRGDFDVIIEFIKNNVVYLTLSSMIPALYPNDNYILFCGVNDETQKGSAFLMTYYSDNNTAKLNSYSTRTGWEDVLYEILTAAAPVLYQWSSVPAISGKNGTLSLTQILNINDGEPVQDVTNRGNLDFSKKTKVNTLVNSVYEPTYKEDQTKATVEYEIPEAEYQYTKLVYKKKKIPKSPSDGTVIDIGADDTEAVVSGLEENTTYYFVVFTNRTKSNAYKFKTGKNDAPEGIFKIRITTTQGVKDSGFKEVIGVTRQ